MRGYVFYVITGQLAFVAASLELATCVSASAASPSAERGEIVAYVEDDFVPKNVQLPDIVHVKRQEKWLKATGNYIDLMEHDQIYIVRQDAAIIVRILATNEGIPVRKTGGDEEPDYTVPTIEVPGLLGERLAWLKEVLVGANSANGQSRLMGSRAVKSGTCYNISGSTNDPVPFQIPILRASSSVLAAGSRAILVSWQGGAQPFSVRLSTAETDKTLAQVKDVRNVCAVYLPRIDLPPGRFRLAVTDANNVKEQEDSLFVAPEAPATPQELREANLPQEARDIYAATWLSVLDGGRWAFEAQQRVSAMDCRMAAVHGWLRQWGGLVPCVRTGQ